METQLRGFIFSKGWNSFRHQKKLHLTPLRIILDHPRRTHALSPRPPQTAGAGGAGKLPFQMSIFLAGPSSGPEPGPECLAKPSRRTWPAYTDSRPPPPFPRSPQSPEPYKPTRPTANPQGLHHQPARPPG